MSLHPARCKILPCLSQKGALPISFNPEHPSNLRSAGTRRFYTQELVKNPPPPPIKKKKKKFSTVSWDCWWGQWSLRIARPSGLLTSMCKPKVRSSTRETFPKRHSRSTVHVRILFQAPQHSSPALFPYPPPCCLNHCLLLCLDFSKARIFSWIVNSSDAWFWSPWNY